MITLSTTYDTLCESLYNYADDVSKGATTVQFSAQVLKQRLKSIQLELLLTSKNLPDHLTIRDVGEVIDHAIHCIVFEHDRLRSLASAYYLENIQIASTHGVLTDSLLEYFSISQRMVYNKFYTMLKRSLRRE